MAIKKMKCAYCNSPILVDLYGSAKRCHKYMNLDRTHHFCRTEGLNRIKVLDLKDVDPEDIKRYEEAINKKES